MRNNSRILLTVIASALFFSSCKKNQTQDIDNESQSSVDQAIACQEFMGIYSAILQNALNIGRSNTGCDTLHQISGDTLFGTAGHVDPVYTMPVSGCALSMPDGKTRSGLLRLRFTGKIKEHGSTIIAKLESYKADDLFYACDSIVLTTDAWDESLPQRFHGVASLVNGTCRNSNFRIKYAGSNSLFYTPGSAPYVESAPYVSVYGTTSGINRTGRAFTAEIPSTDPLTKNVSCAYIGAGSLTLTPEGYSARTVEFGTGACDADATFNVNGNIIAFKLK